MIRELKTYPLLTGFRGSIACDVAALESGATILDARIRVTAVAPRPLVGVRR